MNPDAAVLYIVALDEYDKCAREWVEAIRAVARLKNQASKKTSQKMLKSIAKAERNIHEASNRMDLIYSKAMEFRKAAGIPSRARVFRVNSLEERFGWQIRN